MTAPGFLHNLAEGALAHKAELAGLGVLAVPSADEAQAHLRARAAGEYNKAGVEKRTLLPHAAKPISELAGLGILAGPSLAHLKHAAVGFFDELVKLGAISDSEAQRSVDRLDTLEKNQTTPGQVGRYGALGAAAGALTKGIGHTIEHGKLPAPRAALGAAAGGAIGMGAVPLLRNALDRRAEAGTLKRYLDQEGVKAAALKGAAMGTLAIPPAAGVARALKKMPLIPKAGIAPVIGSGDFGATKFISPGITAAAQNAGTIAPMRGAA